MISYRKYQLAKYNLDRYGIRNGMAPSKKSRLRKALKKRVKNQMKQDMLWK